MTFQATEVPSSRVNGRWDTTQPRDASPDLHQGQHDRETGSFGFAQDKSGQVMTSLLDSDSRIPVSSTGQVSSEWLSLGSSVDYSARGLKTFSTMADAAMPTRKPTMGQSQMRL